MHARTWYRCAVLLGAACWYSTRTEVTLLECCFALCGKVLQYTCKNVCVVVQEGGEADEGAAGSQGQEAVLRHC